MPTETKFWYLKHFDIFAGLDARALDTVARRSTMNALAGHEPIYFPGTPSRAIFFLKSGHVKLTRTSADGREVILDVLGPGEIFGELVLGDGDEERRESATALDEVVICTMRLDDFETLLHEHPTFTLEVTKRLGLRLRKIEERVVEMVFKDVRQRIASFLVRYAEEYGRIKDGVVTIKNHLTQEEISFLTGSARQTATTVLNELRELGILEFSRKTITIFNFDRLRDLSR